MRKYVVLVLAVVLAATLSACGTQSVKPTPKPTPLTPIQLRIATACKQINFAFRDGSIMRTGNLTREQQMWFVVAAQNLSEVARENPQYLDLAAIALAAGQGDTAGFTPSRNVSTLHAFCLGAN